MQKHGRFPGRGVLPAAWCLAALGPAAAQGPQDRAAPVAVAPVVVREVAAARTFVGTLEPARRSTVGASVEGRVVLLAVREGERVVEGRTLAKLRSVALEIEIEGAQAELEARRQELAELEAGSRPEEILQARARSLAAAALDRYAAARLARARELFEQGNASEEDLEEALSAAERAAEGHAEARATLELALAGPRAETVARARALLEGQEHRVRHLLDRLAEHTIAAPFHGHVTARRTEVGQWLSRGNAVVDMVELDFVEVVVAVGEDLTGRVRHGDSARVMVEALPQEAFTGHVAAVVPQADPRTRAFPVRVRVENRIEEDGSVLLKAGMSATVTLALGSPKEALLAPKDALVLGGLTPVVFVLTPAAADDGAAAPLWGTVRAVAVELGVAHLDHVEVLGDLAEGDLVVVEGNERLRPGQRVEVVRAAAPPEK